jgi:predicted metal-dependent hydrolase
VDQGRLIRGIELFNRAEFFEAHEELEEVWRGSAEPEKKFLQALIQSAVALHHHSQGNLVGAKSILLRSFQNLGPYPKIFAGINVERLREDLTAWRSALEMGSPGPPFPKLEFEESGKQ